MKFSGEYECKLDAKGRLLLPARLKAKLPEGTNILIVARGLEPCLCIYLQPDFTILEDKVLALSEFVGDNRQFQRKYLRGATETDIDNQGRMMLPKSMLDHAGIAAEGGTIILQGIGSRIEVWEPAKYEYYLNTSSANIQFSELSRDAERLLGNDTSALNIHLNRN
jgi:MraZ protein